MRENILLCWLLLCVVSAGVFAGKPGYLLTLPKVIQTQADETVCMTLHNLDPFDVHMQLKLLDPQGQDVYFTNQVFHKGEGRCFTISVVDTVAPKLTVVVRGTTEFNPEHGTFSQDIEDYEFFNNETTITVQQSAFITFIQPDKPIYKPGQPVKFRIMTVKPDLTPLEDRIPQVYIQDPNGVRIMQWLDVKTEKGLGDFEMPLSQEPVLGTWKISALIGGSTQTQDFKVEEYVLPKFEVTINPPAYVLLQAPNITAEVCAKYTYGKPVRGILTGEFCVTYEYRSEPMLCTKVRSRVNGCTDVTGALDFNSRYIPWDSKVLFKVAVEEDQTGVSQTAEGSTNIERAVLKIDIKDHSPDFYKPGLTYRGKARVTHPDGAPAPGVLVGVRSTLYSGDSSGIYLQNFTSDADGFIAFSLPSVPNSPEQFSLSADIIEYKEVDIKGVSPAYLTIKQWYSRSRSYLQIEPLSQLVSCDATVPVHIYYTTPLETTYKFNYIVMSRGNIVTSGHKHHHFKNHDSQQPSDTSQNRWQELSLSTDKRRETVSPTPIYMQSNHVSSFTLELPITHQMSPLAHLVIYYVREDGETVADHSEFSIEPCLANKVSLELGTGRESVRPGQETNIRLTAQPGSLCSLAVVDKSVHVLAGNNQLSPAKVFQIFKTYEVKQDSPYGLDLYCQKQVGNSDDDSWGIWRPGPPGGPIPFMPREPRAKRMIHPGGRAYSRYYDSIQAFKSLGAVVITDLDVETRPCERMEIVYKMYRQKNSQRGSAAGRPEMARMGLPEPVQSNHNLEYNLDNSLDVEEDKLELRDYFPETWLWDLHHIGSSGEVNLAEKAPHTITTWMGSSFCSNSEVGLGVAFPASLKVFQPFFASFNLPYSVIRGERVPVSVSVFNYLTDCLVISLNLEQEEWFEMSGPSGVSRLCVCGGESKTHTFSITPVKIGELNLTVKAESTNEAGICDNDVTISSVYTGVSDAVKRPLIIEPEGKEVEDTESIFWCPTGSTGVTKRMQLVLPASGLVPDSARAYFSVIGDVMGPALSGLDKLLKLPTGCGEQNMLNFAPNIFIMQYLTGTNQVNTEIKSKAIKFMTTGYQRELTYRHTDGSYSAFGNSDPEGSMWLTAFVTKSFAEAQPFIYIDQADLNTSVAWIRSKQLENGCFPQVGKVLHKAMKGGVAGSDSPATLTAYVLIALLESGVNREEQAVKDAVLCLKAQAVQDTYTTALMTYAMSLYDIQAPFRLQLMDNLDRKAIFKDGMEYWTESDRPQEPRPTVDGWIGLRHETPSADVEMTAYALLAKLASQGADTVSKALPIVRWLTSQRNADGGFSSTQDTVVGLQALARYATLVYREDTDINVMVNGSGINEFFPVDADNNLLLQQQPVQVPNILLINAHGVGCVFIQASVRYNILNVTNEQRDAFTLSVNPSNVIGRQKHCRYRNLRICAKYNGADGASNMVVLSVKMVSGWIPVKDSLKQLQADRTLGLKRYEVDKNWVNLYFDELRGDYLCLLLEVEQDIEVQDSKPALVKVYDYYDPEKSAEVMYKLKTTCGTKEELPYLTTDEGNQDLDDISQSRINMPLPDDAQQGQSLQCPVCPAETPSDLAQMFCASTHAYKVDVRATKKFPLKVQKDLREANGERLNTYLEYILPDNCQCPTLQERGKILILTKETEFTMTSRKKRSRSTRGTITLAEDVTIVPLRDRETERMLRQQIKRNCA